MCCIRGYKKFLMAFPRAKKSDFKLLHGGVHAGVRDRLWSQIFVISSRKMMCSVFIVRLWCQSSIGKLFVVCTLKSRKEK